MQLASAGVLASDSEPSDTISELMRELSSASKPASDTTRFHGDDLGDGIATILAPRLGCDSRQVNSPESLIPGTMILADAQSAIPRSS